MYNRNGKVERTRGWSKLPVLGYMKYFWRERAGMHFRPCDVRDAYPTRTGGHSTDANIEKFAISAETGQHTTSPRNKT